MNKQEQQNSVCEKLPELLEWFSLGEHEGWRWVDSKIPVDWETQGLQVCHEAEKWLESDMDFVCYFDKLEQLMGNSPIADVVIATYEQRLEALCRVWFPEKWT